ncbi:MAG: hypothetical protein EAZ92_16505 [Candidatus Kapaibacterium sp.]|nr:MAG: hypothetical protein EAZ92_16505 [Candidatus Kapabacteria bacterium]
MNTRFLPRKPLHSLLSAISLAIMLILGGKLLAQTQTPVPAFTIFAEVPEFGAVQQGPRNIVLRERRFSLNGHDSLPQRGRIVIRRVTQTNATVTLKVGVSYVNELNRFLPETSTATVPLPSLYRDPLGRLQNVPRGVTAAEVPINTITGDLTPFLFTQGRFVTAIGTTETGIYQFTFAPQVTEAFIIFIARWSDQTFPNNPGLQGTRTVTVALLPDDAYTIPPRFEPNGRLIFHDISRITLEDPENVAPIALPFANNLCPTLRIQGGREETRVLLSPVLDAVTLLPQGFFYDENYDPLNFTAEASNTNALTASILPADTRFGGQPSLSLLGNSRIPSTTTTLSLTARDARGGTAEVRCSQLAITTSVREKNDGVPMQFSAAPNPSQDGIVQCSYSLSEAASGVQCEVFSVLGERILLVKEGAKAAGTHALTLDMQHCAGGAYMVRFTANGRVLPSTSSLALRIVR